VAEGVEEPATLDAVARLGIDFAQGFYIAEPEALPAYAAHAAASGQEAQ
jgi:EAL domain-containing protein (putative c-di-GMP-specific phosphodiesterase class I)